ncbi:MAG: DsbC family protein [Gallionellaceae bacterium]|nr:DsbC family protein [Gallionellaceae bacterium]MDD5365382.1 DsbC family protein [Gallionellaceae bacterium]
MRILTSLLLTLLLTTGCNAGQGEIKKNLEARFPGAKVDSVSKTPVAGIYEVVIGGSEIVYSDANGDHLFTGDLLETASRRNLTREKADKLSEVKFDTLPLDQSFKIVKGDGKRKLAVFSDPDCPYCKKLEQELSKLDNVTIYTFIYPLPMHADSPRKSRLVWCSADRAKAWNDLMLNGTVPEGKDDCANPVEANLELGQKLNIQGTPAIILGNGKRLPGLVPADRLNAMLDEAGQ